MKPITKRCAVYTRKSTEEGLEQDFNSLDAQREGCLAYITSQKAEGWAAVPESYDDGGFTGGNMERPALQRLLQDIKDGKVNIVVVYKIDRLTRSLMDFSKLVEVFDAHGVTFVSITQSFNTTTSMGRLTLNVLLSFAQFEREVIGERVRDKIAASKKKGMWMGGTIPLGYQRVDKVLVPKPDEVPLVRMLFERYEALGTVPKLMDELVRKKIVSPARESAKGKVHGGVPYGRGALYSILTNPIYIGQIRHKRQAYEGQHEAIIDADLWQRVQEKLQQNTASTKTRKRQNNILQGKLFDAEGTIYSPTHTKKGNKRYRYYISQNLLQYRNHPNGSMARLPADEIETLIANMVVEPFASISSLSAMLELDAATDHENLQYIVDRHLELDRQVIIQEACPKIVLADNGITVTIDRSKLVQLLNTQFGLNIPGSTGTHIITKPYTVSRTRKGAILLDTQDMRLAKDDPFNRPDHEIQNWVKGVVWREQYFKGKSLNDIAAREKADPRYVMRLIEESLAIA